MIKLTLANKPPGLRTVRKSLTPYFDEELDRHARRNRQSGTSLSTEERGQEPVLAATIKSIHTIWASMSKCPGVHHTSGILLGNGPYEPVRALQRTKWIFAVT